MQTPDGLPMAEVDPLGDSGRRHSFHPQPAPLVFAGLTDLLAYRVPYNRPARTMPWGMEKPARRWLAAARFLRTSGWRLSDIPKSN